MLSRPLDHHPRARRRRRARRAAVAATRAAAAVFGGPVPATAEDSPPTTAPAPDTATAVWPYASSDVRYDDPVDAARGFAVDFAGFVDPQLSEFRPGDSRSGEVEIGPPGRRGNTTVFVRQLGPDDSWWVLGSASGDIVVDEPGALDEISSPVHVTGRSTAFEATVPVEVRQDGSTTPIGSGFVMGGAGPELEPFSGDISFSPPTQARGALVFLEVSARDGSTDAASVLRVRFAATPPATTTTTAPATPTTSAPPAAPVPATPTYTG